MKNILILTILFFALIGCLNKNIKKTTSNSDTIQSISYHFTIDSLLGTWVQDRVLDYKITGMNKDSLFTVISGFTISKNRNNNLIINSKYFEREYVDSFSDYKLILNKDSYQLVESKSNKIIFKYNVLDSILDSLSILRKVFIPIKNANHFERFKKISNKIITTNIEQYALAKRLNINEVSIKLNNIDYKCKIDLDESNHFLCISGLSDYKSIQITDYFIDTDGKLIVKISLLNKQEKFIKALLKQLEEDKYILNL